MQAQEDSQIDQISWTPHTGHPAGATAEDDAAASFPALPSTIASSS